MGDSVSNSNGEGKTNIRQKSQTFIVQKKARYAQNMSEALRSREVQYRVQNTTKGSKHMTKKIRDFDA